MYFPKPSSLHLLLKCLPRPLKLSPFSLQVPEDKILQSREVLLLNFLVEEMPPAPFATMFCRLHPPPLLVDSRSAILVLEPPLSTGLERKPKRPGPLEMPEGFLNRSRHHRVLLGLHLQNDQLSCSFSFLLDFLAQSLSRPLPASLISDIPS